MKNQMKVRSQDCLEFGDKIDTKMKTASYSFEFSNKHFLILVIKK